MENQSVAIEAPIQITTPKTSYTFDNLSPDTNYVVDIHSMVGTVQSSESSIDFRTSRQTALRQPINLRQIGETSRSISVSWETNPSVKTVSVRLMNAAGNIEVVEPKSLRGNSVEFNYLEPSRKYKLEIVALDGNRRSMPKELYVHTAPASPSNINIRPISSRSMEVTWANGIYATDNTYLELYLTQGMQPIGQKIAVPFKEPQKYIYNNLIPNVGF